MKLSIVATLYQSAPYIAEFHRRVTAAASSLTSDYEIILVNDGSPDDSLARAVEISKQDSHVVVVDLSRNFGHHKAIMTGLAYAKGERIFLIDSDLEEEPEWLPLFTAHMNSAHCDVVYGVQETRKGGWFERFSGDGFYHCYRFLTGMDLPKNFVTARLMTKRYVEALLQFQEREIFLGGLWHITGFDQQALTVKKHGHAPSTYSLSRKLALFVNAITSFTNRPLILIFYVGITIFGISFAMACWLTLRWLLYANPPSGWTSVMLSVWLLGGLMISFIGVVGIYISKIFSETKARPYTIVKDVYGR